MWRKGGEKRERGEDITMEGVQRVVVQTLKEVWQLEEEEEEEVGFD
jgi:hypothetical protein